MGVLSFFSHVGHNNRAFALRKSWCDPFKTWQKVLFSRSPLFLIDLKYLKDVLF
jgi:hypothetical protein